MMDSKQLKAYLKLFESEVLIPGIKIGNFSRKELIPVRRGRLSNTRYGRTVGILFESEIPFVIDYYGHLKRSSGFQSAVSQIRKNGSTEGRQIKRIESLIVHFASIKLDQINRLTKNPEILINYSTFKDSLLKLRGFRKI